MTELSDRDPSPTPGPHSRSFALAGQQRGRRRALPILTFSVLTAVGSHQRRPRVGAVADHTPRFRADRTIHQTPSSNTAPSMSRVAVAKSQWRPRGTGEPFGSEAPATNVVPPERQLPASARWRCHSRGTGVVGTATLRRPDPALPHCLGAEISGTESHVSGAHRKDHK